MKKNNTFDIVLYAVLFILSFLSLYPFLMVLSGSLTTQKEILSNGYRLIPREFTFKSYATILRTSSNILNAYRITIVVTLIGTFTSLLINGMMGYILSLKKLKYRKILSIYTLIPILFTGGMVPWYIVCVNYLHLKNSMLALILPMLANGWYVFLIRNYFNSIALEMYESAHIDGAGDYRIFFKIYLPLAKPVLATVGLFLALAYWNDWWLGLMLIDKTEMQPLQMFLHKILSQIQFLRTMDPSPEMVALFAELPAEGLRMAMVIITIGPILLVYPFVQRYFVKGIMIGAVKG